VTKPNPENCKNGSSKCAYDCAQLQYTIQHRTVLTSPLSPPDNHHSSNVLYWRRRGHYRYCYRDIRRVDLAAIHSDIQQSPLYDFHSATSVDSYVELFNSEVERILDKHAPLKSRTRRVGRHVCRWLSADAREAKRRCRRRERRYRKTHSTADKLAFQAARDTARDAITRSRSDAIRQRFDDVTGNSAAIWRAVRNVLHRDHRPVYSDSQCRTLSCGFSQYFTDKLERIHQLIAT